MSLFAFFSALAAVCVVVGSLGVGALRLVGWLALRTPGRLQRSAGVLVALALGPWLAAAALGAALVAPALDAACHCGDHGLHHPHLCLVHPSLADPLVVAALVALGVWTALVTPRVVHLGRQLLASLRFVAAVRRLPVVEVDGVAVHLGRCGRAGALTAGLFSPIIVVDRELWARLLTLFALRLASALAHVPAGERLLRAWRSATERACDAHAALRLGDAAEVAAALLSVERWRTGGEGAHGDGLALALASDAELEQRVLALLDEPPTRALPKGNDLWRAVLVGAAAIALTAAVAGDALHHAVESALGLIVR